MNEFTTKTWLHTHVESKYDAFQTAQDVFDKAEKCGITAIAITDHGSLNALQDFYDEAARRESQINIIYGVELYVASRLYDQDKKTAHMIIMARNAHGKKGIDRLMYMANENINSKDFPVVTTEMLEELFSEGKEYADSCIFTTACIAGLPSLELLANEQTETDLDKLKKKLEKALASGKAIDPDETDLAADEENLIQSEETLEALKSEKEELGKISKKKTDAIRKRAASNREKGLLDKAAELDAQADEIEKERDEAAERLHTVTNEINATKKKIKNLADRISQVKKAAEYYTAHKDRIDELQGSLLSKETLFVNAKECVKGLMDIVGKDNLYIEIQYHGLSAEEYCYNTLIKIARELDLPLVAANDAHMTNNEWEDLTRREVMKFLRYGELLDETEESIAASKEMYLKTGPELAQWLLKVFPEEAVEEAMENCDLIADSCRYTPPKETHYPVFDKNTDSKELLRKKALLGIEKKFPGRVGWSEEYEKRLERELDVICSMGYADYHLIVADFIEYGQIVGWVPKEKVSEVPLDIQEARAWCKERGYDIGLGIGPGRGSAAGSLVCYLLGITNIDPIRWGLLFERFLNPERYSMPDIDVDFALEVRPQVTRYVTKKYGENAITHIITKSYQQVRGAIRDAAKYYGASSYNNDKKFLALGNTLRKKVPNELGITFDTKMPGQSETVYENLMSLYSSDKDAAQILKIAKAVEGTFYGYGQHAAGVVLSDNSDIREYIPLRYNTELEQWTTCVNKEQIEELGFLKFDFLNLRNLSIITEALRMIYRDYGVKIDPMNLPLEDEVILNIYGKAHSIGVFQFESAGMRSFLSSLRPNTIDDVYLANAIFRPGPLQFIPDVIAVKSGKKPISYLTPELEPILKDTYGSMIYQEQIMQICIQLAGYPMSRADSVRKMMSKKQVKKLLAERNVFLHGDGDKITGCVGNGIAEDIANKIFDEMEDFAKYAFNKSHAVAYSIVSYATAYLKYHYPAQYICALLNYTSKTEKYMSIIKDARDNFGVEILPPDINHSQQDFSVYNNKTLFGLGSIKGIKSGAESIIKNRLAGGPFKDYKDFILRSGASDSVDLALIRSGAFDSMGYTRVSLESYCRDNIRKAVKKITDSEKDIAELEEVLAFAKGHTDITDVSIFEKELRKTGSLYKVPKKCPTVDSLQEKMNKLLDKRDTAKAELDHIKIRYIKPDRESTLKYEKELLGIYLTAHPTDGCIPEGQTPICDVTEKDTSVTGVIASIDVRYNKQNRPWATLTIEDRSGELKGVCFPKQYEALGDALVEGNTLTFNGTISVDDFSSSEENIVYSISIESVEEVKVESKTEGSYVLTLNDLTEFHGKAAELKTMEREDGVPLWIYFIGPSRFSKVKGLFDEDRIREYGAAIV